MQSPPPARRRRVAVVGTGFMGTVHTRAARRAGADVVAVVGRTLASARRFAEQHGVPAYFDSVESMLADSGAEAVHVCTPNDMHAEHVQTVLKARLPVVCEKPLATTAADAQRLLSEADAAGVVHVVPFVYRFYPMVRELRSRLARGEGGRISLLHGGYLQDWLAGSSDTNWRVDAATGGASRAFADIGIHWCDLAEFVTGQRISKLTAMTSIVPAARTADGAPVTTEDIAAVLFQTDHGSAGTLKISQVSVGRKNQLQLFVDAEAGSYGFDQEHPDQLWAGGVEASTVIERGNQVMAAAAARYSRIPAGHPQGYQDCFDSLALDAYAAMDGEQVDGLPTFDDGVRSARLTEAVLTSARTGAWVDVDPTGK
ncbi:Gfo/Idh/MocA family protein [Streptomyces sp. NPDC059459]|uniref:Gfo/Idh/MocA family protein n=1 Tax=Streptomyces sp. NPDC059459 TaxID=3346839 RepID=UPI0036B499D7